MFRKIPTLLLSLSIIGILVLPMLTPITVAADDIQAGVCSGTKFTVGDETCTGDKEATGKIDSTIKLAINLFSLLVGVVSVIMIIVGGLKYIISAGDSSNVTSAKNTLIYAIVGLVIVVLAQFIVHFVLDRAVGCPADKVRDKTGACVAKP